MIKILEPPSEKLKCDMIAVGFVSKQAPLTNIGTSVFEQQPFPPPLHPSSPYLEQSTPGFPTSS